MLPYLYPYSFLSAGASPRPTTNRSSAEVVSGFRPMVRGHPRAMLAPDASVGKVEKLESEMIEKYYD